MTSAAESVRDFGEAMQRVIDNGARDLGKTFASRHGSHVKEIAWGEHDNGQWSIYIDLTDGHRLQGRGGGKLDALADAEEALR